MTRRLTPLEWESVCERADERRAAGGLWHLIEEELAGAGVCDEDLDELQRRHRQWSRREQKRQDQALELPAEVSESREAVSLATGNEEARKAVLYICGEGLLSAKPVWRGPVYRTLKPDDVVTEVKGPGKSWMVRAVVITHANGTRTVLAEHRIRQRIPAGWMGKKHPVLKLEVLDLEEGLNTQGIVRRVAAVIYGYFAERSGVKNGSHLAKLSGVSRQAVNTTQQKVRAEHRELTGKSAGLAGQVPARRPKKGKAEGRGRRAEVGNQKSEVCHNNQPQSKT